MAAGPVYAAANADVVALASSVHPVDPSARHTSSYTSMHGRQIGLLAAELLGHHQPEEARLVQRLDDDRRQRGVGLRPVRFALDDLAQALRPCQQGHPS